MRTRQFSATQPLALSILSGMCPPETERRLFDDRIERISYEEPTDLVAMTVETHTAKRAYAIAANYRKLGVPVVMGGFHPSLHPEEALQHADSVAVGDGEGIWPQIVNDGAGGKLKPRYLSSKTASLEGIVCDREIFKGKKYTRLIPVQYGRGCASRCDFCSVRMVYGNKVRHRPVGEIVREIEGLRSKLLLFVDDNFSVRTDDGKRLLKELAALGVKWSCQTTIDAGLDEKTVKLMADSGCRGVFIGFESFDENNLRQMKKARNLGHGDYSTVVRRFKDNGIMVWGSFLFGYDYDTVDSFKTVLDFSMREKLLLASFNPLFPTPATELYRRLEEERRLLFDRWWLAPNYRYGEAVFRPRKMTPEQLSEGCFSVRREFNQYSSIARRCMDKSANTRDISNLAFYLQANLISRREIYSKQGAELGT